MKCLITATVSLALTVLFAAPLTAQTANPNDATRPSNQLKNPGMPTAPAPTVDDATLKKAARAFPKIRQINLKVQEKLKETPGTHEQSEILNQARNQEITIVRQEGIDPNLYNEVMRQVDRDPAIKAKFASYVKQVHDPSSSM